MRQLRTFGRNFLQRFPFRLCFAVSFAAITGFAVARSFLGTVSMVSGTSMLPTYEPGAWVYVAPISAPPGRGDIVVVDDGHEECAIKRVVGLPGELVHIKHGYVFINRKMLIEPYLPKRVYTFPTKSPGAFVLGENQYFVLGDNRPGSVDSRAYGPIDRNQIKRRIPLPQSAVRAHFSSHMLPACEAIVPPRPVHKVEG